MQPHEVDTLFGSKLISKIMEVLLKAKTPLSSNGIMNEILLSSGFTIDHPASRQNLHRRVQNKLKEISQVNTCVQRVPYKSEKNIIFFTYSINQNEPKRQNERKNA